MNNANNQTNNKQNIYMEKLKRNKLLKKSHSSEEKQSFSSQRDKKYVDREENIEIDLINKNSHSRIIQQDNCASINPFNITHDTRLRSILKVNELLREENLNLKVALEKKNIIIKEEKKGDTNKKHNEELLEKIDYLIEQNSIMKSKYQNKEKQFNENIRQIYHDWYKITNRLKTSFDILLKFMDSDSELKTIVASQINKIIKGMYYYLIPKDVKYHYNLDINLLTTIKDTVEEKYSFEDVNYISVIQKLELENKGLKGRVIKLKEMLDKNSQTNTQSEENNIQKVSQKSDTQILNIIIHDLEKKINLYEQENDSLKKNLLKGAFSGIYSSKSKNGRVKMIKSVSFSDHARNSSINSSTKKISKNRLDLSSKNKLKFNDNSIDILDEEIVKLQKELVILKNRMLIN